MDNSQRIKFTTIRDQLRNKIHIYYNWAFLYHYFSKEQYFHKETDYFIKDVHSSFLKICYNHKSYQKVFHDFSIDDDTGNTPFLKYDIRYIQFAPQDNANYKFISDYDHIAINNVLQCCSGIKDDDDDIEKFTFEDAITNIADILDDMYNNPNIVLSNGHLEHLFKTYQEIYGKIEKLKEKTNTTNSSDSGSTRLNTKNKKRFDWCSNEQNLILLINTLNIKDYISKLDNNDINYAFSIQGAIDKLPIGKPALPNKIIWRKKNPLLLFLLFDYLNDNGWINDFDHHTIYSNFIDSNRNEYKASTLRTQLFNHKNNFLTVSKLKKGESELSTILDSIL